MQCSKNSLIVFINKFKFHNATYLTHVILYKFKLLTRSNGQIIKLVLTLRGLSLFLKIFPISNAGISVAKSWPSFNFVKLNVTLIPMSNVFYNEPLMFVIFTKYCIHTIWTHTDLDTQAHRDTQYRNSTNVLNFRFHLTQI